jgi:hypothetical protein
MSGEKPLPEAVPDPAARLIREGPMPLAQLAQRARNSKSGAAMLQNAAHYLGEAGAALAAAFWSGRARSAGDDWPPALREKLAAILQGRGATFGAWIALLREGASACGGPALARLLGPLEDVGPFDELAAALEPELGEDGPFGAAAGGLRDALHRARRGGVLGFLDFLAAFRNRVYGHGTMLPETVCRRLAAPFLAATAHALRANALWDGHWLGCTAMSVLGEGSSRFWRRLSGLDAEFLSGGAEGAAPPGDAEPGVVCFVGPAGVVALTPLVVFDEDATGLSRFGFYQRLAGGKKRAAAAEAPAVEYLGYVGGSFVVPAGAAEARQLLGRLSDVPAEPRASVAAQVPDAAERRFGDFVLEEELGRGAMGIV